MSDDLMNEIAAAKDKSSIIMVVGVGGAGGNAVNHMWNLGIKDVGFMVCNTDAQALDNSPVEEKVQLGREGLGAGNDPENGRTFAYNDGKPGPWCEKLYHKLRAIQYGEEPDTHGWNLVLE